MLTNCHILLFHTLHKDQAANHYQHYKIFNNMIGDKIAKKNKMCQILLQLPLQENSEEYCPLLR